MRVLNRAKIEGVKRIIDIIGHLDQAQNLLQTELFNQSHIQEVKNWSEELLQSTNTEEQILKQKTKIN